MRQTDRHTAIENPLQWDWPIDHRRSVINFTKRPNQQYQEPTTARNHINPKDQVKCWFIPNLWIFVLVWTFIRPIIHKANTHLDLFLLFSLSLHIQALFDRRHRHSMRSDMLGHVSRMPFVLVSPAKALCVRFIFCSFSKMQITRF